jgi:hypothetical protein
MFATRVTDHIDHMRLPGILTPHEDPDLVPTVKEHHEYYSLKIEAIARYREEEELARINVILAEVEQRLEDLESRLGIPLPNSDGTPRPRRRSILQASLLAASPRALLAMLSPRRSPSPRTPK